MTVTEQAGAVPASGAGSPFGSWIRFSVLSAAGTAVAVVVVPEFGIAATAIAAMCALAVGGLVLALLRPDIEAQRRGAWRSWTWSGIALVLFTVAVVADQWSTLLLFCISPAVFLAFALRTAIPIIVVFDLAPFAVSLLKYPLTVPNVVQALGTAAVTIVVSVFFAGRVQHVVRESEERRRLIEELRAGQAEIAALSAAQGASAERARIAREMHDTLAQGFASIVALGNAARIELATDPAATARHLELITATAAENLAESRRIIAALTPGPLVGSSLTEAVRRTVAAFRSESGVQADAEVSGEVRALGPAVDVVLLRVTQEALTNVRRHAHATRAEVRLAFGAGDVTLEITDDGAGFDAAAVGDGTTFGLAGMSDRVAEIGGELAVRSEPGHGTRLRVRIPAVAKGEARS